MSADWPTQAAESWKLTLPCTRAEADALLADSATLAAFDPPPTLMTSEPDPAQPDAWLIDVYVEGPPPPGLAEAVAALAPSGGRAPSLERLGDEDWVTKSQAFLEPIHAGRFHVHTAAHAATVPAGATSFLIEAGRAFGTGHHETTAGCLEMLDRLATAGRDFRAVADIGTGTGLLAFAARALWPAARIVASDIDPVAIDVTRENMVANRIPPDAIGLVACDGVGDPRVARAGPYDLLIANILAGPLIALAADFAEVVEKAGVVMLAGLLQTQEQAVLDAYRAADFDLAERLGTGEWPVLALVKRA